jgi:formate-dependent nitrite reductase membrane component NrfD
MVAIYWPLVLISLLTTAYTGLLFAQGLARDLWQGPQSVVDLVAQAIVEGSAALLLASMLPFVQTDPRFRAWLAGTLVLATAVHLALILLENVFTPSHTRHHELATTAIRRGAFSRLFWGGAIGVAAAAAFAAIIASEAPAPLAIAAALALAGSFAWEFIWVEAGQSVPLS